MARREDSRPATHALDKSRSGSRIIIREAARNTIKSAWVRNMNLEKRFAAIARTIFFSEFSFPGTRFKAKSGHEYELADHVVWIDNLLIALQLKERQPNLPGTGDPWFENKVLKKATRQVRDTLAFLRQHDEIEIENQSGHRFHLIPANISREFMVVVYDEPQSGLYRARPNHHVSRTAGLIHCLHASDFIDVCRTLITPAEIADYLDFRGAIIRANEFLSERAILGQFLLGATAELPTEHNVAAFLRFRNERSRFDIRWFFQELPKVIHTTRLGDERSYYEILKEYAMLDRFDLEQFRLRIRTVEHNLTSSALQRPFRMINQRGTCFMWVAIPKALFEKRLILLQNFTGLAKYDGHVDRCVGMAFTKRSDGLIEFDCCYMEGKWRHDPEVEEMLNQDNPFRPLHIKPKPGYLLDL